MKTLYFFFLILLSGVSYGQIVFQRVIKGPDGEVFFNDGKQTFDGGYIFCGYTKTQNGHSPQDNSYLVKTDSIGEIVWANLVPNDFAASGILLTRDSGYVMISYSPNFQILKFDKLGNFLWGNSNISSNSEYLYATRQTSDGGFVSVGKVDGFGAGGNDVYLLRLDSLGGTVWSKTYGSPLSEIGQSITIAHDGGFLISGMRFVGATSNAMYLIRTDSNGDTLWTRNFPDGWAYSAIENSDSSFTIGGELNNLPVLLNLDKNGNSNWTKSFSGSEAGSIRSLVRPKSGGYLLAGYFGTSHSCSFLIRTDESGDTLWTKAYSLDGYIWIHAVDTTMDSGYILTGEAYYPQIIYSVGYVFKTDSVGNSDCFSVQYPITVDSFMLNGLAMGTQVIDTGGSVLNYSPSITLGGTSIRFCTVGIEDTQKDNPIVVFPNPCESYITIRSIDNEATIHVYSITGAEVLSRIVKSGDSIIDVKELSDGVYILKYQNREGNRFVNLKLIIAK